MSSIPLWRVSPTASISKTSTAASHERTRRTLHGWGLASPAEEIGKSDFDFYPPQEARRRYEQEQQIIQTGQPLIIEEKNVRPDGQVDWGLTIKMPLRDEHGNIIGTFGISHDITALKQIEESLAYEQYLFNTIMDSAPYAIWFKDAAGRFIRVNRTWANRRGLDDPAIAVGKTDFDFSPERDCTGNSCGRTGHPQNRAATGG